MGKYSETRYANMIPAFELAPLPASEASGPEKSNMRVYETLADLPTTSKANFVLPVPSNLSICMSEQFTL